MKKKLFSLFAFFHIAFIVSTNLFNTYSIYCEDNQISINKTSKKIYSGICSNPFVASYARFSGAEAGYGFFAPNVKSTSVFISKSNDTELYPQFNSYETSVRYSGLISTLIGYVDGLGKCTTPAEKKIADMRMHFNELVMKNLSVKLLNLHNLIADSVYASLNYVKFPSLSESRHKHITAQSFFKIQEVKFTIK
jgi:hypothetical protein